MRLTKEALQFVDSSLLNVGNLNAAGNLILSETAQRGVLHRIQPIQIAADAPTLHERRTGGIVPVTVSVV